MRAVNLDTYSLSLLTAKEDILNPRSSTNWALFTYDGVTNNLKLTDSGAGGLAELAGKFHTAKPQYGLCRAASSESGTPIVALISWMGKDVAEFRRTECASHVPAIRNFFKEAQVFLGAEKAEDVMEEKISAEFSKVQPPAEKSRRSSRSLDKEETVGTNYRKTNAALEMRRINRDSFWARAEREEEQRKEEERRRAAEERRRLERERVTKERSEAEERERKMDEKLQRIEEQRRRQAELEEGMRKQEKARWETQQREHEEDMRARLRHSESIEKAAEAAALVSQRSINPREFFRQLSSNSSQSPSSPNSPRTGKPPLRRYQRSLTDSGYSFGRMDSPTSPRSPTLVSPFFRAPPSPLLRPISPASSTFHPFTYPVRPKAPIMSPPASPLRPTPPPVSALPTLPSASSNSRAKGALSPQPSAPPASPGFLSSLSPGYPPDRPPQAMPPTPPDSPLQGQARAPALGSLPRESPTHLQPELSTTCPVSPETTSDTTAHNREQYMATFVHTEMGLEAGYMAQAVLVEEEDEVEEELEEADKAKPEPCMGLTQPSQTAMVMEGETAEKLNILGEDPLATIPEGGGAELDRQARDQSNCAMAPAKLSAELSEEEEELSVEDLKQGIPHQITQDVVIRATNGLTNGEDLLGHNGTEGSVSLSDTGSSPPELASSCDMHSKVEDCIIEYEQEELCENGKEVLPERQLCVRALYDYQAEDETEISFEPGDIISDVETVDNAWWRGYSKDGRQGLFPANYVETI